MVRRIKYDRFTPEPQMDWSEIRKAKVRCEQQCALFDHLSGGGCSLCLLPSLTCWEFKRIIRMSGSSSVAERLFADEEVGGSNPPSRFNKRVKWKKKLLS